jgi:polyhydroxybutyrate depolymerase
VRIVVFGTFGVLLSCSVDRASDCALVEVRAGATLTCVMPGYTDRAFELRIPARWDGSSALPLIVALHGGGGFKASADSVTCPGGDRGDPRCLGNLASDRGYAVAAPNGTGERPLRGVRHWNAGGDRNGYACGFEAACALGIDDVAYIETMFGEIEAAIPLDASRSYATGISNGGAMSHRLGCELRERFAAIAPVAGANIHADSGGPCADAIPILDLHSTGDPLWPYEGGSIPNRTGYVSGADETMENWRIRNGCSDVYTDELLPDRDPADGSTSLRRRWTDCAAATELIRIDGGGHTWPSGHQYLGVDRIGGTTYDFGSELILDFFDAHVRR